MGQIKDAEIVVIGYAPVLALRITYVGELGWELHIPVEYAALPDGYGEVQRQSGAVREAPGRHDPPTAPRHRDPLAEKFLDTGERVFIIDYEFTGNNDPMRGLGDLSVEAAFDAEHETMLLNSHFGGELPHLAAVRQG